MRRFTTSVLVLLIFATVAGFLVVRTPGFIYVRGGAVDLKNAETYWSLMIRVVGASRAEAEMEREGKLLRPFDAHVLAHSFGAALYELYGDDAFSICSTAFAYGCFHELSGLAIAAQGSASLNRFAESCKALPVDDRFGCMHGVGHGLVANLGYSFEDLTHALARCHALDPNIARDGCTDGAVMEYQLRIMADGVGNLDPRPFDPKAPFSPCDAVSKEDRYACIFETPAWWLSALPESSDMNRLVEFGKLCGSVSGEDRRACVEGSGFWLASALDFNTTGIQQACGIVSNGNTSDDLSCLSSAARRFRSMHRSDVDTVCMRFALSGDALNYCTQVAHSSPLSDPRIDRPY